MVEDSKLQKAYGNFMNEFENHDEFTISQLARQIREIMTQKNIMSKIIKEHMAKIESLELEIKTAKECRENLLKNLTDKIFECPEKINAELLPQPQFPSQIPAPSQIEIIPPNLSKPKKKSKKSVLLDLCENLLYSISKNVFWYYDLTNKISGKIALKKVIAENQNLFACAKYENIIYISGGQDKNGDSLTKFGRIKIKNTNFECDEQKLKPMRTSRYSHAMIALDEETIFVLGGISFHSDLKFHKELKSCEIYRPNKKIWVVVTAGLNEPKVSPSLCNFNNEILYAFGSLGDYAESIEKLDYSILKAEWEWKNVKIMNLPRELFKYKVTCNFIEIRKKEILVFNKQGESWEFQTNNKKLEKKENMSLNTKNYEFNNTEPILYKDEVFLWNSEGGKILAYSIKDGKWREECKITGEYIEIPE